MIEINLIEFGSESPLYEETLELRYRTFFKEFNLPKSITPDELEPLSSHFALFLGTQLVAYGRLSPLPGHVFKISQLIVPLEHRGNGYARALLRLLVEKARDLGGSVVELNAQVSVQSLYLSCGFLPTAQPYKVQLTGVEHVPMEAAL